MNSSLINLDELRAKEVCKIKGIVSKIDEIDLMYINSSYTLKGEALREVLERYIYSDQNIPFPTQQQIASWSREEGVTIEKVADYISSQKIEKKGIEI